MVEGNNNMLHIDIKDDEISIDDKTIHFPASYDDLRKLLGSARIESKGKKGNYYIFDKDGITFEDADELYLKRNKGFIDREHLIAYVSFYIDDDELFDGKSVPKASFKGSITFFGEEWNTLKKADGSSQYFYHQNGELRYSHIKVIIRGDDSLPNYEKGLFKKSLYCTFAPERPKTPENYNISEPQEECVKFTNMNFKLAVIQELMYRHEILKPYFDIYDYMKFKKSRAKIETEKNIRAAIDFFKALPIPKSLAQLVTQITMDGGDEIYGNIAPLWDGEDGRFDVNCISPYELRQFPNLKRIQLMTSNAAMLYSQLEELGIEVIEH